MDYSKVAVYKCKLADYSKVAVYKCKAVDYSKVAVYKCKAVDYSKVAVYKCKVLNCLPKGRHSEGPHEIHPISSQNCSRGGVGHVGVGWVM